MPIVAERIELRTYRQSTALQMVNVEKFGDRSGYRCELVIRSGGFSYERPFYFDDDLLADAILSLRQMNGLIPGKATLRGIWEQDFLQFLLNDFGHVIVSGELHEHAELSQLLSFAFRTDQTVLAPLIQDLEALHLA